MEKTIGIDLGTTNSVAAIRKVSTEVLKNADGEQITPSCVTVKKRTLRKPQFIVGRSALEWLRQEPENTVTAVKRLIGRNYHDREIQELIAGHGLSYRVAAHSRGSENSIAIFAGGEEFTPEEISAKILGAIKEDAEKSLDSGVDSAVITVPAYFNDKQKHATRTAAALAGLKVRRLLPEPTAAAISFGVDTVSGDQGSTVLVFDFGGGTLDLSILTISGGQIIEMGKGGDMWLGGEDIDRLIIDHVLAETAREEDIEDIRVLIEQQDPARKNRFLAELKTAVEKAKIALSDNTETFVEILGVLQDEDGDGIDVEVELTRQQFEEMLAPKLKNMVELVRKIIQDVHFTPELIDNILLVGGSSRIPAVRKAMQEEFGAEKVMLHERPMLAIAEGAAILSHRLADVLECPGCGQEVSQSETSCPNCSFDLDAYTVDQGLVDIVHAAAHDYSIGLEGKQRFLMVEKNTPLPCSSTEIFQLVDVEQELVHMKFYNMVNEAEESIGDLWLGIDISEKETRRGDKGKPSQIEITLDIDENNLVSVNAALRDQPEVNISKTLSRGQADEKLFLSLEKAIHEADEQEYSSYTIIDLLNRTRFIIKSINGVVDDKTGEVDEAEYKRAKGQIEKAIKIAEDETAPVTKIYYAESMLELFSPAIPPAAQKRLRKKLELLRREDQEGSYKATMRACDGLSDTLDDDDFAVASILSQISNAAEYCIDSEPAKASQFMKVVHDMLKLDQNANASQVMAQLSEIMPQVNEVLDREENETRVIHKDIRK